MASRLLAFKLAIPVAEPVVEPTGIYDPVGQVMMWRGGDRALAVRCSDGLLSDWEFCNAYDNYCAESGRRGVVGVRHYICDD